MSPQKPAQECLNQRIVLVHEGLVCLSINTAFTLAALRGSHQHRHHEGQIKGKSATYGSGGEGGILTLAYSPSYHLFSNMHENRMHIGYFYDLACFNSFNSSA